MIAPSANCTICNRHATRLVIQTTGRVDWRCEDHAANQRPERKPKWHSNRIRLLRWAR